MGHKDPEERKSYNREYYWRKRKQLRKDTKLFWVESFGGKCVRCGYSKCIEALQFHHENPEAKEFAIFNTWRSHKSIAAEIQKCILVCGNCHVEIHQELGRVV